MTTEDVSLCERLDREFDQCLALMKHHVLQLPLKADRQRCALWIKKLCEPPTPPLNGRKIRNSYVQLMFKMLQQGSISGPLHHRPPSGVLEPLPSQLLSDFPAHRKDTSHDVHLLPSWLHSDPGDRTHAISHSLLPTPVSSSLTTTTSRPATFDDTLHTTTHRLSSVTDVTEGASYTAVPDFREKLGLPYRRRAYSSLGIPVCKSPPDTTPHSPHKPSPRQTHLSADDIDIGTRRADKCSVTFIPALDVDKTEAVRSIREPLSPRHHRWQEGDTSDSQRPFVRGGNKTGITDLRSAIGDYSIRADVQDNTRELETKLKVMEAKYQEEKLVLQQKHDSEVQKILHRKNIELDEMKTHYTQKVKDSETYIAKMDHKVLHIQRDHEGVCVDKDQRYTELRALLERTEASVEKKFEEKLSDAVADMEQDKYEMQKLHTKNIQEILDDTNVKLQKMDAQYAQQILNTTSIIGELEQRVQQVTSEASTTTVAKVNLEQNKVGLEEHIEQLTGQLNDLNARHGSLERDHGAALKHHESRVNEMMQESESVADYMQAESNAQLAAANEKISSQNTLIDNLKISLHEMDEQRVRQLKELADARHKDKLNRKTMHEKQINTMKSEMELRIQELECKNKKFSQQTKDKEGEVSKLKAQKEQVTLQADKALADFKAQVERNQARIYEDMKLNIAKIEADLDKSRQMRERQSKEFIKQRNDDCQKHDTEMKNLKQGVNAEKNRLIHEHQVEKEKLRQENIKLFEAEHTESQIQIHQVTSRAQEKYDRQTRSLQQLEAKVGELRDELLQANQSRKQQLVELSLAREEEKQGIIREHEAQLNKIQAAMEQQQLSLLKSHSLEMENQLQKTNVRLKVMQKEYEDKAQKYTDTIQKLQFGVQDLHNQLKKQKDLGDKTSVDMRLKCEDEKKVLHKKYAQSVKMLKQDLDSQRNLLTSAQNKLQQQCAESQEQATKLQLQNELKLNDRLPASIQKDYEETISSLKSQIHTLQQTVTLLSDELSLTKITSSPQKRSTSKTRTPQKSS